MSVLIALISGLAHASWNALAKRASRRHAEVASHTTSLILSVALAVSAAVLGVWSRFEAFRMPSGSWPFVALAGLGEAAYVTSLARAYAKGDLALTYTISRASALVVIWPISALLFGTSMSGLALVATGVVVGGIGLAKNQSTRSEASWSIPWTLATGLFVGVYHAGYKGAVEAGADALPAFVGALAIAVPGLWLLTISRLEAVPLQALGRAARDRELVLAGVLSAVSFVLLIVALRGSDSGRMLGVRNSSVGFALVLAAWMGERPSRRQWAGLGLMLVGVVLFGVEELLSGA